MLGYASSRGTWHCQKPAEAQRSFQALTFPWKLKGGEQYPGGTAQVSLGTEGFMSIYTGWSCQTRDVCEETCALYFLVLLLSQDFHLQRYCAPASPGKGKLYITKEKSYLKNYISFSLIPESCFNSVS